MISLQSILQIAGIAIGGILTGLFAVWAQRIATRSTRDSSKEANAVTFSASLIQRITALEKDMEQVKAALADAHGTIRVFTNFVDRIGFWNHQGRLGQIPQPHDELHEHVDMSYWGSD